MHALTSICITNATLGFSSERKNASDVSTNTDYPQSIQKLTTYPLPSPPPSEAPVQTPLHTLEMMFFSIFGLVDTYDYLPPLNSHPAWSQTLIKFVFGSYMIVAVVVLINLLIAMMSDTYQRIQVRYTGITTGRYRSDILATSGYRSDTGIATREYGLDARITAGGYRSDTGIAASD